MQLTARKAVSPIIATLLLIAIAVAAGIIVYVFTSSITGSLTVGGGTQVSEQVSMDAYTYPSPPGTAPVIVLRNVGGGAITLNQIFFDGNLCQLNGATCTANPALTIGPGCTTTTLPSTCGVGVYTAVTLGTTAQTAGTSHLVRVVTSDGGTFSFSIITGRSG